MTARSGVEYDGTDPRAGMPFSSRTASSGGMPSVDRKLATIGLADPLGHLAQRRAELLRAGHQRREEHRDDRVHAVVVHRGLQRGAEVLGRAVGADVDRLLVGQLQPLLEDGVGDQARRSPSSCRRSRPACPAGSGWWASSVPTSNICATVSTRITPAEANSARHRLLGHRDRGAGQPAA